jgi:accessory colonization factor AcfC
MKKKLLVLAFFILANKAGFAQVDTLHVYGPGGPYSAMNECAKEFTFQTGIPVKVIAGPEPKWFGLATQNADLIYEGAEYMFTQFVQNHPGVIDETSTTELYKRAAAILVRPGNPKHIRTLKDLTKPGVHILDVNGAGQLGLWEDIAGKQDLIAGIRSNIKDSFTNTALGIDAWKKDSQYDAWITYASWHQSLSDLTEIVELPKGLRLYRGTPIGLLQTSQHKQKGNQFISFLKSAQGYAIFKKWGWE